MRPQDGSTDKLAPRKAVNLARLLAELLESFALSTSVLKVRRRRQAPCPAYVHGPAQAVEFQSLNGEGRLFFVTMFAHLLRPPAQPSAAAKHDSTLTDMFLRVAGKEVRTQLGRRPASSLWPPRPTVACAQPLRDMRAGIVYFLHKVFMPACGAGSSQTLDSVPRSEWMRAVELVKKTLSQNPLASLY